MAAALYLKNISKRSQVGLNGAQRGRKMHLDIFMSATRYILYEADVIAGGPSFAPPIVIAGKTL